jgi:hypothetical protein
MGTLAFETPNLPQFAACHADSPGVMRGTDFQSVPS